MFSGTKQRNLLISNHDNSNIIEEPQRGTVSPLKNNRRDKFADAPTSLLQLANSKISAARKEALFTIHEASSAKKKLWDWDRWEVMLVPEGITKTPFCSNSILGPHHYRSRNYDLVLRQASFHIDNPREVAVVCSSKDVMGFNRFFDAINHIPNTPINSPVLRCNVKRAFGRSA
jgi:hypothetical protein